MKKLLVICCSIFGFLTIIALLFFVYVHEKLTTIPGDKQIVSELINQTLPGYSQVEILYGHGKGLGYLDPRLIPVRVLMDTGEKAIPCEGLVFFFRGDPGASGLIWETIECEGLNYLITQAQFLISNDNAESYSNSQPISCFKNQLASVLFYWIKHEKADLDDIEMLDIKSLVADMLDGTSKVDRQVTLFDPRVTELIDLAPQLAEKQKATQYYIRCNGILRVYTAKSNMDIYDRGISSDEFFLHNPLPESPFIKLAPK